MLKRLRKLRFVLFATLAVALTTTAFGRHRMHSYVERTADPLERKLAMEGVDPELFPRSENNATVLKLMELALDLGIVLQTRESESGWVVAPDDNDLLVLVNRRSRELEGWTNDSPTAGSEELASLSRRLAQPVDQIVDLVLTAPVPVWISDTSAGFGAPVPNLVAQIQLQRVLCVAAELALGEGEPALAERRLEASWRLNEAILARPELIAQLVGQAIVKEQQPVVRRLPSSSADRWIRRLESLALADGVVRSLRFEAWVLLHLAENPAELEKLADGGLSFFGNLSDLYATWGLVTAASIVDNGVDQMLQQDPSAWDPRQFGRELVDAVPRRNLYAALMLPDLWDSWIKAKRRELEVEHTIRLLELRSGKTMRLPVEKQMSLVGGLSWDYQGDDQQVRVALDGDFEHLGEKWRVLPLEYTVHLD